MRQIKLIMYNYLRVKELEKKFVRMFECLFLFHAKKAEWIWIKFWIQIVNNRA